MGVGTAGEQGCVAIGGGCSCSSRAHAPAILSGRRTDGRAVAANDGTTLHPNPAIAHPESPATAPRATLHQPDSRNGRAHRAPQRWLAASANAYHTCPRRGLRTRHPQPASAQSTSMGFVTATVDERDALRRVADETCYGASAPGPLAPSASGQSVDSDAPCVRICAYMRAALQWIAERESGECVSTVHVVQHVRYWIIGAMQRDTRV